MQPRTRRRAGVGRPRSGGGRGGPGAAAALVPGVAEALAFQVGTRVRLLIRPADSLDTIKRIQLARSVLEKIDSSLGPRVGLTVALLVGRPRHRGEGGQGNGTTRVEGTRHGPRNRPG